MSGYERFRGTWFVGDVRAGAGRRAADVLPGWAIFDNLHVRVSAEVGRHSCE
jgi:hypothetical protein